MHLALCTALLLLALSLPASGYKSEQTAYAIPVDGITIDGRLDDWPERMAVYPIAISYTDSGFEPPEGPADLKASFRVGYDAGENLLYVAVVTRDDVRVIGPEKWSDSELSYLYQDFCVIYIDADRSDHNAASVRQSEPNVAQAYAMVAGPSQFSPDADGNPVLNLGDTRRSGLDVLDVDGEADLHWMAWTPGKREMADSGRFGHLAFVDAHASEVDPAIMRHDYYMVTCCQDPIERRTYSSLKAHSLITDRIQQKFSTKLDEFFGDIYISDNIFQNHNSNAVDMNTDDKPILEFELVRSYGLSQMGSDVFLENNRLYNIKPMTYSPSTDMSRYFRKARHYHRLRSGFYDKMIDVIDSSPELRSAWEETNY